MSLESLHFYKPTEEKLEEKMEEGMKEEIVVAPMEKFEEELSEVNEGSNHTENLYDLNEDVFGNKVNEATGEKIDNSTYTKTEGVAMREVDVDEALGRNPGMVGIDPNDDAAKWLVENGGDPLGK